jgi:glycosyltransferase involved in cell wall biosynthesis
MMINEAIMCGTPVVSFDIGVAPDLVITGQTGYRVAVKSGEALADGLRAMLTQTAEKLGEASENCAALGRKQCSPEGQAQQFLSLFRSICRDN